MRSLACLFHLLCPIERVGGFFASQRSILHPRWGARAFLLLLATLCPIVPAQAEGSRSLYRSLNPASSRANLEWRNSLYADLLLRRTLLRVYLNANEVLLLGSSAMGVQNPATSTQGDIAVYAPNTVSGAIGREVLPGTPTFSCANLRQQTGNNTLGTIADRARELAGANTIQNAATGTPGTGVPGGYTPCYFRAPSAGIYSVVITGPSGVDSNSQTIPNASIPNFDAGASQDTSIAAWDVTVRSSLTSTNDLQGRLFTYYLALYTGANNRPIEATVYAATTDGFIYETNLNGIDPNGFIAYGNRVGFLNTDGTPLNRNVVATGTGATADQLNTLEGGVRIAPPEFPIFFNAPDRSALNVLNIPAPSRPVIGGNSLRFVGSAGRNNSFVGTGGTFSYSGNIPHVYELVISRGNNNFDPTDPQNRVLRGTSNASGNVSVQWNGLDNSGTPFPIGENYPTRLIIRAGEYHFPLLDVENSIFGSPRYRLTNPPNGECPQSFIAPCVSAFYDDRGYLTASGALVGAGVNVALEPDPAGADNSDFTVGFNTAANPTQRQFDNGFGDKKGLDLWTYYPSNAVFTPLNIVDANAADLSVQKTVDRPAVGVGGTATFTILLTNNGPSRATNVNVSDRLPNGLTFVSATPSQGTYDPTTGIWNVGTLNANSSLTLQITVTVTITDPVRNTATIVGSAQPDPESANNEDTAALNLPNLRLVKRITAVTRSGSEVGFPNFVDDPNDANDNAAGWAQLSPVGVLRVDGDQSLKSGDQVEYTIYFLSDGSQPVLGVNLCDQLQPTVRAIANSNQVQLGAAAPVAGGTIFSPLAPLPAANSCADQSNPNGAIVFNLGNISNTAGQNYGFVRFRIRLN